MTALRNAFIGARCLLGTWAAESRWLQRARNRHHRVSPPAPREPPWACRCHPAVLSFRTFRFDAFCRPCSRPITLRSTGAWGIARRGLATTDKQPRGARNARHGRVSRPWRALLGSSPRAWGTPHSQQADPLSGRFIPTCVGNTVEQSEQLVPASVHPHVRGEHHWNRSANIRKSGSSPRAWGTHNDAAIVGNSGRFIPTCVGNTQPRSSRGQFRPVHPHVRGEHPPTPRP